MSVLDVAFWSKVWAVFEIVPWFTLGMVALSVAAVIGLLRYHRAEGNRYDLWDLVMSGGKADLSKHIIAAFAVLTIWLIVFLAQKGQPVEALLTTALGIFVAGKVVQGVVDTIKGVPKDEPMQDVIPKEEKDAGK